MVHRSSVRDLIWNLLWYSQFSHSVVSNSLRPRESQDARPTCPSTIPEFTQTHVHRVGDAIQPSHPLSSPSPPAPNPSQHQGLFQWVNSSHQVAKVREFQLQHQSFQWIPRTFPLGLTGWISLQSKGLSRVFSNTTVQNYQSFWYRHLWRSISNWNIDYCFPLRIFLFAMLNITLSKSH